jgi:hypothetical protein
VTPPFGRVAATVTSVVLVATLGLAWWGEFDAAASDRTQAALQRALVTYALSRTLNGIISVAQGTELAFQPAGVGVVLTPGEILDPLNDLVEQFSTLTLLAATSLGLQIMLGQMFATPLVNSALSVAVVFSLLLIWWTPQRFASARPVMLRLTASFIFLRFAIAAATLATGYVNEHFLTPRETASVAYLSQTSTTIASTTTAAAPPATTPDSVLDRLNQFIDDQRQALDIERRLSSLKQQAETAVEEVVNLIVVYIIETLLLPLGFLVVGWALVRQAWRRVV